MYFHHLFGNITDYEAEIVSMIHRHSRVDWFTMQSGSWNDIFQVQFAEILTARGFGFAFNIFQAEKIYRPSEYGRKLNSKSFQSLNFQIVEFQKIFIFITTFLCQST